MSDQDIKRISIKALTCSECDELPPNDRMRCIVQTMFKRTIDKSYYCIKKSDKHATTFNKKLTENDIYDCVNEISYGGDYIKIKIESIIS